MSHSVRCLRGTLVATSTSSLDPEHGPCRALIVDDSHTIAAIVKHFLQLEGFDVLVASDGLSGLEAARREHPRVIVTDVNMPGMNGLDMVRTIRADERTRDIAIFMLTADESAEGKRHAHDVGVDDYVLKSLPPRSLAARVKAFMDHAEAAPHE